VLIDILNGGATGTGICSGKQQVFFFFFSFLALHLFSY
jgi:hypothetical protein